MPIYTLVCNGLKINFFAVIHQRELAVPSVERVPRSVPPNFFRHLDRRSGVWPLYERQSAAQLSPSGGHRGIGPWTELSSGSGAAGPLPLDAAIEARFHDSAGVSYTDAIQAEAVTASATAPIMSTTGSGDCALNSRR